MNSKHKVLTGNPTRNSRCQALASRALNTSCYFGQSARSIESRCVVKCVDTMGPGNLKGHLFRWRDLTRRIQVIRFFRLWIPGEINRGHALAHRSNLHDDGSRSITSGGHEPYQPGELDAVAHHHGDRDDDNEGHEDHDDWLPLPGDLVEEKADSFT